METYFTWRTKLFSRRFDICRFETVIGSLEKVNWSKQVAGELNGRKLVFKTSGFAKQETHILDLQDNSLIGSIHYNTWRTQSTIKYQEKEYSWEFDNFWRTRWKISNINGAIVRYQSKAMKGTIQSYTGDEVLILAGFFIRNLIKEKTAHVAAAS